MRIESIIEPNNLLFFFFSNSKEPRKVLPILKTDEPICPEGKLSCGNGECLGKELFCDGNFDCKDESDENACSKNFNYFFSSFLWIFTKLSII